MSIPVPSLSSANSTLVRLSTMAAFALTRGYFRIASRVGPAIARRQAETLFTTPPAPLRRFPIPAAAKRLTVLTPAGQVAVWQAGPDSAPGVLLVHGWGGVGAQMGPFVAPLLETGRRVVWYDHPGHGDSDGKRSSLPDLVRALEAIAGTCGPFEAAIGHSLGGAAVALALRQGLALQRAVMISSPASMSEHIRSFARRLGITATVRDTLQHKLEARHGMRFDAIDRLEELGRVQVPTLLIHDADDRQVPFTDGLRIASHLPNARLIRTHGLGHQRLLRNADLIRHIVEFATGKALSPPAELPGLPDPAPLY